MVTPERRHKATFAKDKRKGGYLIRIEGPNASAFVNKEVPVTMRNGDEQTEKLVSLVWSGHDANSGKPVALYTFEQKPKQPDEEIQF